MNSLSVKSTFSAAHFYNQPRWSEEKNRAEFGLCYSEFGHGHDYVLEVKFQGEDLLENLAALQQKVQGVTAGLDHQHLNFMIPEFKEKIPTTENIALYLWGKLKSSGVKSLKLYETADLWVEVGDL